MAAIDEARLQFEQARSRAAMTPAGDFFRHSGSAPRPEWLARSLSSYDIGEEIHRGGQGTVFKSIQRGTQREVAIKVMHEGPFRDMRALARFEREIQILGQLKHPNIVTIHESGSSENGFYFVMDYVEGETLDQFVARHQLDVRATLALFAKICDAVNVAHLRGVIHRDLKPANIRVDRSGEPHVLDFGLAKVDENDDLAGAPSAFRSITGQFVGSIPWASPEQVAGDPGGIDVRTDVYSLGVMLFQALTRQFPYDVTGSARQVLDNICNAEPRRPAQIRRDIDDEVDAIIMTCVRKDKARRYQSAGDLARDIDRYLRGLPIEAKRDNSWYVLSKQIRRHRVPVAIAAMFIVVITVGLVVSLTSWRQAVRERDAAAAARVLADEATKKAQEQEAIANAVVRFLTRDVLEKLDPYNTQGRELSARALFDQAAIDVDAGAFSKQPLVEFEVRTILGVVYIWTYENALAEAQLRPALAIARKELGDEHEKTIQTIRRLGTALSGQGKMGEAEPLLREALEIQERMLGAEDLSTVLSRSSLAAWYMEAGRKAEAAALYRVVLEARRRIQGPDHANTLAVLSNLASCLVSEGEYEEAEAMLTESLEAKRRIYPPDHPEVQMDVMQYANLLLRLRRADEALPLAKEARESLARSMGVQHPSTQNAMTVLGVAHELRGEWSEAEALYRELIEIQRDAKLKVHRVLDSAMHLVSVLGRQNRWAEAEVTLRELDAMLEDLDSPLDGHFQVHATLYRVLNELGRTDAALQVASDLAARMLAEAGPESDQSIIAQNNHGLALLNARRPEEAAQVLEDALKTQRRLHGNDSLALNIMHNLAIALGQLDRHVERESLLRDALAGRRAMIGDDDPTTLKTIHALATTLLNQGRLAEAEPLYREALTRAEKRSPAGSPQTEHYRRGLGVCMKEMGRFEEAEKLLLTSYERDSQTLRPDHPNLIEGIEKLTQLYAAWGRPDLAATWQSKLDAAKLAEH